MLQQRYCQCKIAACLSDAMQVVRVNHLNHHEHLKNNGHNFDLYFDSYLHYVDWHQHYYHKLHNIILHYSQLANLNDYNYINDNYNLISDWDDY